MDAAGSALLSGSRALHQKRCLDRIGRTWCVRRGRCASSSWQLWASMRLQRCWTSWASRPQPLRTRCGICCSAPSQRHSSSEMLLLVRNFGLIRRLVCTIVASLLDGLNMTQLLITQFARPGRLQTESSALARGDTVSDQATPDLQLHQSIIASQIEINIAHCDVIWIH